MSRSEKCLHINIAEIAGGAVECQDCGADRTFYIPPFVPGVVHFVARSLAENFCGCCGAGIGTEHEWCSRCSDHVRSTGQMHTRTFYAQHGRECPFQIAPEENEHAD